MKVFDFPLAKITISFLIGILVSYYIKPSLIFAITTFLFSTVIIAISYLASKNNKKFHVLFGISTFFISFCLGIITLVFHTQRYKPSNYTHFENAFEQNHSLTFIIREKLKSNAYNDRYIAVIKTIDNRSYSGKVILNIRKDKNKASFLIGNIVQLQTTLKRINRPKNPNQFDYAKYLSNKQIYAQIHTEKSQIKVSTVIKKDIWYYASKINSRIIRNLEKAKFNKAEMNVALALILGQRQDITAETVKNYQASGASHILSVSGLHVGFIMLFILFILKPIPNTKKGSLIKLIILITSLSTFAIISGLSPPVLRSVIMFSFLSIADHLRRDSNTYHTLLVSALLILLFQPYFLFDVGFQLSYIALFSILWLQPLLKQLWTPNNKITTYIWEALVVCFAAQIGTFPICLYYFHQFPGLFFVTNILILPLISFIMIIGIIVMLLSVFTSCPYFLIQLFEKSIFLLNQITQFIASFESFIIKGISFNFSYAVFFYLLLISSIVWLKKPAFNKLIVVLISIVLLQLTFISAKRTTQQQKELIVYHAKKNTYITEKSGRNTTIYSQDTLAQNNQLDSYLTENFGILEKTAAIRKTYFFNNHKILLIDSSGVYKTNIHPDIIILTQSVRINLDRLAEDLKPKLIIADGTNSSSIQKYWKASCLKKNIPFHATAEKGYYKLNLDSKL